MPYADGYSSQCAPDRYVSSPEEEMEAAEGLVSNDIAPFIERIETEFSGLSNKVTDGEWTIPRTWGAQDVAELMGRLNQAWRAVEALHEGYEPPWRTA